MSQTPTPPGRKPIATDTKQAAPRRLLMWIVPLAIVAVIVMLLSMHGLSGVK